MTDFRNTNTIIDVLADWNPPLRSTNTIVDVLADWNPFLRSSSTFVEVLADWNPPLRVTQYHLEVAVTRGTGEVDFISPIDQPRPVRYEVVSYGETWPDE